MAAAATSMRLATRCRRCRIATAVCRSEHVGRRRTFTTSSSWLAAPPGDDGSAKGPNAATGISTIVDGERTTEQLLEDLKLDMEERFKDEIEEEKKTKTSSFYMGTEPNKFKEFIREDMMGKMGQLANDIQRLNRQNPGYVDDAAIRIKPRKAPKAGFASLGIKKNEEFMEDPEVDDDDISSIAHAQLDQHREFRHYARLIAWEMPLLTKMAKPFEPPTKKQVLRFRYTTYMGEQHPAEKKVVVEFCPADMPDLTPVQREKLKKLVGPRYNPNTDIVKMSSEMFPTQAQNKRYLGDLVDTLLTEARDPTDTFEDIPLDTRHHPIKVKPKFPREWRMTPERQAQLEEYRARAALTDYEKERQGALIDGVTNIEASLSSRVAQKERELVMAPKTRGRTLAVRR